MLSTFLGACAGAGCSYPLSSLLSRNGTEPEATGSVPRPGSAAYAVDVQPPEADLAYARAVAADALARGGKDISIPWANPNTGAGGNITPLAVSYSEAGTTCRDFLASYVHGEAEAWLQGEACRSQQGKWEVKSLKPLRRS